MRIALFFERYAFDTDRRELRRGPDVVPTTPQVFDLLDYLICNRERVVSKGDLDWKRLAERPTDAIDPGCVKTLSSCYDSPVILLGESMRRFVEEADRWQRTLLSECLDDFIDESNPVRVIDVFVDALGLAGMGFEGVGVVAMIDWARHSAQQYRSSWRGLRRRQSTLASATVRF
jgi:hypothetical protein